MMLLLILISSCNNSTSDWTKKLVIPTRFSNPTMKCIETGILSSHARDEIINSLSTCIMLYTTTPTSYESEIICQRLVETHKTLKDSLGSGLGYVSEYSIFLLLTYYI